MSIFKSIKIDTNNATGDPFGRVRMSFPETLLASKQTLDNQPLFWDDQEVSGSGTSSTHSTDLAASTMGVSVTTAGVRIRQTFQRLNYEAGKGQLGFFTGVIDKTGGGADIIRRIGLYDDDNGLFFEDNAGTMRVVVRSSTSGSPVDSATTQASWNIDPMDGTGPSGITLDITKTNIYIVDFEWLGVGRVRFAINIDGVTYPVHAVNNANNSTTVYMSNPNLPVRYEIRNGGTGAASTMDHICAAVVSEGGSEDVGVPRTVSTDTTEVSANVAGTIYPVVGIRLKSTHLSAGIKIVSGTMLSETNDNFEWMLLLDPTITGTFTYADETNSAIQSAKGNTATATGGTYLNGGYGAASSSASTTLDSALRLGSYIDGTPNELVLCVRPLSANADIRGSLTWRELS